MTPWRRYTLPGLLFLAGAAMLGAYWLLGSGDPGPVPPLPAAALPSPQPPATIDATPSATPSSTPSATPSATPRATPRATLTATARPSPTVEPSYTPGPLVPTRTPTARATASPAPGPTSATARPAGPTATVTALVATMPAATATPPPTVPAAAPAGAPIGPIPALRRFGAAASPGDVLPALAAGLPLGSFLDWHVEPATPADGVVDFWQMVRLEPGGLRAENSWEKIAAVLAARPGSIWILGNEPDVVWQDGLTPQQYAGIYHDLYTFIKAADPAAKVAIGGVSQSTPLRRAYLDQVLQSYQARFGQPLPVDIWNVHGFILREEAGSWGVGIPPGMGSGGARLYEVADHDNLAFFKQNLIDFRAWMAARGYGDRPLAVTEYGILMPPDYGFPPEKVAQFLRGSLDFFTTAADSTGYAPDGGRLVQWWFWYSLYDGSDYPTGNLFLPQSGQLTLPGQVWASYGR